MFRSKTWEPEHRRLLALEAGTVTDVFVFGNGSRARCNMWKILAIRTPCLYPLTGYMCCPSQLDPLSCLPPLSPSLAQRKTPTVIHPGYKISRIRSFYMRKVKFTQETISERLGAIIGDFPRLDVSVLPLWSCVGTRCA